MQGEYSFRAHLVLLHLFEDLARRLVGRFYRRSILDPCSPSCIGFAALLKGGSVTCGPLARLCRASRCMLVHTETRRGLVVSGVLRYHVGAIGCLSM